MDYSTMRKTLILLILSSQLAAEDIVIHKEWVHDCKDESIEHRASFTLECIKNANPSSDEEPEDWIRECEYMALNLYCKKAQFDYYKDKDWNWTIVKVEKSILIDE
jgi:hypothetical protein